MSEVAVRTPMQYLDKAVGALRDVGLMPTKVEPAPINALLEQISDLEPEKIQVIARTLGQASVFNEVVRDQISGMEIGERYKAITDGFNSIRDDAKSMVDQLADSKLDLIERATNVWMKISRGDIADRFDKVRAIYLDVTKDTKGQIDREHTILEAYLDYRGALKQSEVLALEVLKVADRQARKRAQSAEGSFRQGGEVRRHRASRSRPPRACARRAAAPRAGRGEALPDRQGPLGQSHHLLQHLRSGDGAAAADHQRQGAHLRPVDHVLLDQRLGADRAQGLVHRHVRAARVDRRRWTP